MNDKNSKTIEDQEFLVTKKFNEDSGFALWGGGINGPIIYGNSSEGKYILVYDENGEFVEKIEGWDDAAEKEVERISEVIDEKKSNLDANFELLDDFSKHLERGGAENLRLKVRLLEDGYQ